MPEDYKSLLNLATCLLEEAAEVAQVMMKAERFGLKSYNPQEAYPLDNASLIASELGDLLGVMQIIEREYLNGYNQFTELRAAAKEPKIKRLFSTKEQKAN